MKRVRKFLLIFLAAIVLACLGRYGLQNTLRKLGEIPVIGILLLPVRVAALLVQSPDHTIAMPLVNVRVRQIANTWHGPRGKGREHEGQDIFARRDTPVYSATNGIVMRIGTGGLGGNAIWILGAGGREYYYAHLSSFAGLRIGEPVTPSTLLGYVGNTGNARTTPPHLHFGVYSKGRAINPLPLLTDRTPAKQQTVIGP